MNRIRQRWQTLPVTPLDEVEQRRTVDCPPPPHHHFQQGAAELMARQGIYASLYRLQLGHE